MIVTGRCVCDEMSVGLKYVGKRAEKCDRESQK